MQILIPEAWSWFCIALAIVLLTSLIMGLLEKGFYTRDTVLHSFSILDLELAATAQEIVNVVKGIYALPEKDSLKVRMALRRQLYIDFLFMPAAYGAIFILCMQLSWKMPASGASFFSVLAWLQLLPWLCDIIENIYLLGKIRPNPVPSGKRVFKAYRYLEAAKWGIAMFGIVCGASILLYFWLSGYYVSTSLRYVLIIALEVILFFVAGRLFKKKASLAV